MARKFKLTILYIFLKIEFLDTIWDFLTVCYNLNYRFRYLLIFCVYFLVEQNWKDLKVWYLVISCREMLFSLIIWWFATKECQECAPRALLLSSPSLVLLNWPLLYYCCIPWQIETTTILVTLIGRVALTIHWWRPFSATWTSAHFKNLFECGAVDEA